MADAGLLDSAPDAGTPAGVVDVGSAGFDDGSAADPSLPGDASAAPVSLLATTAQPDGSDGSAAPATDSGPNWITRLGMALAGGPAGITALTPAQTADTGTHALLNFGLQLMQGAGPSFIKKSPGQIIAPALAAAEETESGAEQAAAVQKQAAAELGLQAQDRQIKLAQFKFQMGLLQRSADAAQNMMRGLTGAPAAAPASGTPSTGAGTLQAALPPPNAGGNINTWQDPGAAALVVADAQNQGVDPNIALAVAHQESGGNPNAPATDDGAHRGMFQIGVPEAASVGVAAPDVDTLMGNVHAGVGYLKSLIAKYGDVNTALVAYNAGQQRADDVVAGKATIPASTQQYISNVHNIVAGNPAGTPSPAGPNAAPAAAPGAPPAGAPAGGAAAALATPAPGDPGYVPSSGMRTTVLPGAPPGAGTVAPGIQNVGIADLPFGVRQAFASRLQAALGDPTATQEVLKDVTAAVTAQAQLPRFRILPDAEARTAMGTNYQPTAGYAINQTTGEPTMFQQPTPPVPLTDTPQFQADKVALDLSKTQLDSFAKAADSSRTIRNQLDELQALNAQVGAADVAAQNYPQLTKLMQTLGVGTPEEQARMTAQQAFQGVAAKLAVNMRDQGTGRLSTQELQLFQQSLPNIGQDPQSRQMLINMLSTAANRQISENTYAQRYFMQNRNTVGLDDAMEKPVSQGGLGPMIQRAPAYGAPVQAYTDFLGSLNPGQVYYKPNGTLGMKPRPGAPAAPGQ
jgi:soluble lytic murein transglycosylase-like protein